MFKVTVDNPCIRCGKERIVISARKVREGSSLVIITQTSCPDSECQIKVDSMLEKERLKREELSNNFPVNSRWARRYSKD